MIISVNIYAFASVIIFLLSGCKYSWSTEMWMFLYHVSNQCVSFSFYAIFCKYISIIFIIVLIDVFVICKARFMYKKSKNDAKSKQMNSKEICFLVQVSHTTETVEFQRSMVSDLSSRSFVQY